MLTDGGARRAMSLCVMATAGCVLVLAMCVTGCGREAPPAEVVGDVAEEPTVVVEGEGESGEEVIAREPQAEGRETSEAPSAPAEDDEELAEAEPQLTEDDLEGIPEEFRPGESTALEAALMGCEDWVGRVQSHSDDWATAVVWIGPPNSEWTWEMHLKWNIELECYELVKQEEIPYPG